VQGVGFRYAAERSASALRLTGWAKNLRDGRVEIVCEGKERDLDEFLKKIDGIFGGSISSRDVSWREPTGEFGYFDIRF
jgi:acylphosphatase